MNLSRLLEIFCVNENFTVELFARQVKRNSVNKIETVKVPGFLRDSEDLSAENVLSKKRSDRALPESWVRLRPVRAKPGRAGVFAPDVRQCVVEIAGSDYAFVCVVDCSDRARFLPAVKVVQRKNLLSRLQIFFERFLHFQHCIFYPDKVFNPLVFISEIYRFCKHNAARLASR